jgi:hypothetical protein
MKCWASTPPTAATRSAAVAVEMVWSARTYSIAAFFSLFAAS